MDTGMWILSVAIWAIAMVGWISNIVIAVGQMNEAITGEFLLRMLGIVLMPLGAVMGFI